MAIKFDKTNNNSIVNVAACICYFNSSVTEDTKLTTKETVNCIYSGVKRIYRSAAL